jgi:hypothetical protein
MRKLAACVAGLVFTAILAVPGSFIGLIGTQGMHGTEPFVEIWLFVAGVLLVVNGLAATVGMFPVALWAGTRFYKAAIIGSVLGALPAGLIFAGSMTVPQMWSLRPQYCFLIPPACAAIAILAAGATADS